MLQENVGAFGMMFILSYYCSFEVKTLSRVHVIVRHNGSIMILHSFLYIYILVLDCDTLFFFVLGPVSFIFLH